MECTRAYQENLLSRRLFCAPFVPPTIMFARGDSSEQSPVSSTAELFAVLFKRIAINMNSWHRSTLFKIGQQQEEDEEGEEEMPMEGDRESSVPSDRVALLVSHQHQQQRQVAWATKDEDFLPSTKVTKGSWGEDAKEILSKVRKFFANRTISYNSFLSTLQIFKESTKELEGDLRLLRLQRRWFPASSESDKPHFLQLAIFGMEISRDRKSPLSVRNFHQSFFPPLANVG